MKQLGIIGCAVASLAMASCAMDEDTSTSEQDLGGVTVSVSCDSGTSSVIFASTVSGGTAPYTYAWSSISNTGPLMHLPMHPESVHATCDATRHPPTSAAQVVVTDSLGAQGSGSCSVACNAGPW